MADKLKDEEMIGIPEFYKGKSVLLTGFTGCVGKLVAEKIIYSCPDVKKIYVLVRSRKGQSAQERVEKTLQSAAFNRIRDKYGDILNSKIVAISSDILEENLGLSKEDEELLKREVNIVLHGAASVRFDDPIALAIRLNTSGTKMMADFALTMPHLKSFVYVSTAYTNCDRLHIEEKMYPPKADWKEMLKITDKLEPAVFNTLYGKVIGGMPNTYVFSKSLAENVINDYRDKLPVAIVRPSIVVAACNEPMPGWVDNKYGPMSLLVGFFLGIMRCSWVDLKQKCNYISSDIVVNAILVVSWRIAKSAKSSEKLDLLVYNVCSPLKCNVDHEEFSMIYKTGKLIEILKRDNMSYISTLHIKNKHLYKINVIFRHVIPALVVDLILKLMKSKFQLLPIRIKVFTASEALSYFTMRTFIFEDDNFAGLLNDLNENDKESFGWNLNIYSLYDIYNVAYNVMRKYTLLKPLYDDIEKNRIRFRMLYIIDRASVYLTYGTLIWLLYNYSIPQKIFFSFLSFFTLTNKYF